MEPVRYSRVDGRKASSKCSTLILVMFVALCLVGVWMLTSLTVTSVDFPLSDNKSEVDEHASNIDSKSFQDVSDDALDTNINVNDSNSINTDSSQDLNTPVKPAENLADKAKRVDSANDNESAEDSKNKTKFGTEDNNQHKINDQNPDRTTTDKQEKINNKNSDGTTPNEKAEQSSNEAAGDGQNVEMDEIGQGHREEKVERSQANYAKQGPGDNTTGNKARDQGSDEVSLDQAQADFLNETTTRNGAWSTQAAESKDENEVQTSSKGKMAEYSWRLCNVTAGADYIPCLDNEEAIKKLPSNKHYEHRERHCPEDPPTCLVRLPEGYRQPIWWPKSRDKVYYKNVPHTKLVAIKGHQNWVKVSGEYLTFPGGGTQFKQGALHYIDHVQEAFTDIAWGERSRVILDVGCGVASFGGYLFDRDVLTMSLAPKDEHEAQVQFALERGIPAVSAVMGTKRLPFPSRVFDVIHCARCRVPWHIEGGMLLLELNRLLRPGGFFLWSATPVYRKGEEDVGIWNAMSALTKSMCWKLVTKTKDKVNEAGLAIYQKPSDNRCYERRMEKSPPLCEESDDPDAAWNVSLQACMHRLPVDTSIHGARWPEQWPLRLAKSPYWLNHSQVGVYGKPAPEDFQADYEHWKHVVANSYLNGMGINWYAVRNVMDMRAVYGGFAAALRDKKVWVMNVVPIDSPDTLPIIYDRGLFGIYHDWCESFSTYPRSYDLLHADHLFSSLQKRCELLPVITEVDRILRPEGKLIVRDNVETISELESILKSLHWEIRLSYSKDNEGLLCVHKTMWRPQEI